MSKEMRASKEQAMTIPQDPQIITLLEQILRELKVLNNPAMKMSVEDKAKIAAAALRSGDPHQLKKAKRAINPR